MTWQCVLLPIVGTVSKEWAAPPGGGICGKTYLVDAAGNELDYDDLPPGSMFYMPVNADMESWPWYIAEFHELCDYYKANNAHRRPLFVVLPGRHLFLVDGRQWSEGKPHEPGWTVIGDAPNITVSPSINIGGSYHGYLQGGVITDECEGRKFDAMGNKL